MLQTSYSIGPAIHYNPEYLDRRRAPAPGPGCFVCCQTCFVHLNFFLYLPVCIWELFSLPLSSFEIVWLLELYAAFFIPTRLISAALRNAFKLKNALIGMWNVFAYVYENLFPLELAGKRAWIVYPMQSFLHMIFIFIHFFNCMVKLHLDRQNLVFHIPFTESDSLISFYLYSYKATHILVPCSFALYSPHSVLYSLFSPHRHHHHFRHSHEIQGC